MATTPKGTLTPDATYTVSAWVKLGNAASDTAVLTIKLTDDGGDHYVGINTITATNSEWMQLTGSYTHTVDGTEVSAFVYVERPAAGVEYYIDDISVTLAE
ncbi:MAG: carbohydrate binding domain-containing protein [Thalassotalea sp.]